MQGVLCASIISESKQRILTILQWFEYVLSTRHTNYEHAKERQRTRETRGTGGMWPCESAAEFVMRR